MGHRQLVRDDAQGRDPPRQGRRRRRRGRRGGPARVRPRRSTSRRTSRSRPTRPARSARASATTGPSPSPRPFERSSAAAVGRPGLRRRLGRGLVHADRRRTACGASTRDLHYPDDLVGEVHADGRIWSRALWDVRLAHRERGADTAILEGQFGFDDGTMPALAERTSRRPATSTEAPLPGRSRRRSRPAGSSEGCGGRGRRTQYFNCGRIELSPATGCTIRRGRSD